MVCATSHIYVYKIEPTTSHSVPAFTLITDCSLVFRFQNDHDTNWMMQRCCSGDEHAFVKRGVNYG